MEIKTILQQENGNECIIWATDNNGQVAKDIKETDQKDTNGDEDKEETTESKTMQLETGHTVRKLKKGMGGNSKNTVHGITYG